MIFLPWDEKEDLDGLVVSAPRHESLRHVGHEVWIRGSGSITKISWIRTEGRVKKTLYPYRGMRRRTWTAS
jgi:hypothetical protein